MAIFQFQYYVGFFFQTKEYDILSDDTTSNFVLIYHVFLVMSGDMYGCITSVDIKSSILISLT